MQRNFKNVSKSIGYRPKIIKKNTEASVQSAIIQYIKAAYPLTLYCATAGGMKTSYTQAARMKATGYVRGVPDLLIFEPRGTYHGLMIEVKKDAKQYATKEQKEWMVELNKRGYLAYICKGFDEAKKAIDDYFGGDK